MSKEQTGGPAFPLPLGAANMSEPSQSGGMTLRDYFAGQSIANCHPGSRIPDSDVAEYARLAYRMADAMLKAREAA